MKKLALLLAAVMTAGMLTGCGEEGLSDVAENKPVEQYVTLGEYKGVEVTATLAPVEEAEIEELSLQVYHEYVTAQNGGVLDRPIENGDTANIDYVGKKDDVAFSGGTASDYDLAIGSGTFIDGFEEGLVGVKPGEVVDLELTFPENYGNAELAGAEVIFTVTVNYILPTEMEDAVVANFGVEEYKNVEDIRKYAKDSIAASNQEDYESEIEVQVVNAILNNAEFTEIPEELMEEQRAAVSADIDLYASYYGVDTDTLCQAFFGMTAADYIEKYAENYAMQMLAFQAIANAEGLNISDKALEETLQQYATEAGVETVDEYLGTSVTREDYRDYLMIEKVLAFIVDNAVVKAE